MSVPLRDLSRTRAQSIVEFALVLPLFVLLLFAVIDFGRMEFGYISLSNAAREMARRAAIPPTCSTPPVTPCDAATPPTAADVTLSSNTVDQSFKNYEGFILSTLNPLTDSIAITVTDRSGVVTPSVPALCTLPLVATSCAVPTRFGLSGGYVDVKATYQFAFNPLFQNSLTGMIDASFMQQFATLSTTARAYIE
jgi:hypothetical protein